MKHLKDLSVKELDKRMWEVFSLYIRLRDSNEYGMVNCITCGQYKDWQGVDAGHGISRKYFCTKYHEQNSHAQCKGCNKYLYGHPIAYSRAIEELYGSGTWAELEQLSKGSCKKTTFYFLEKVPEYQDKIRQLLKEKDFDLPKSYQTRLNWK